MGASEATPPHPLTFPTRLIIPTRKHRPLRPAKEVATAPPFVVAAAAQPPPVRLARHARWAAVAAVRVGVYGGYRPLLAIALGLHGGVGCCPSKALALRFL